MTLSRSREATTSTDEVKSWTCHVEHQGFRSFDFDHAGYHVTVIGAALPDRIDFETEFAASLLGRPEKLMMRRGNFSVVAARSDEVTVIASPWPIIPLYFHNDRRRAIVSVWPQVVASKELPDRIWLTAYLLGMNIPEVLFDRTPLANAIGIRPGTTRRLTPTSTDMATWMTIPTGDTRGLIYQESFASELTAAVAHNLDRNISSFSMSGGCDSVALAASMPEELRLESWAVTYASQSTSNSDVARAVDFARQLDLNHQLISYEPSFYFGRADGLPTTPRPFSTIYACGRQTAVLNAAREAGSTQMFSGDGGDTILCSPMGRLIDLIRRGRLSELIRTERELNRKFGVNPVTTTAQILRLAGITRAAETRAMARSLRKNGNGRSYSPELTMCWTSQPLVSPWVTRSACEDLAEYLERTAIEPRVAHRGAHFSVFELAGMAAEIGGAVHVAEQHNVDLQHPYLDHRVASCALAADHELRPVEGLGKPLLAKVFERAGLSSSELEYDKQQTSYRSDAYHGLSFNSATLRALGEDSLLAELGLVRTDVIRSTVDAAFAGAPVSLPTLARLLAAETWVRQCRW